MRTRRSCEGSVPGIAPLSTAGLLAMAMMAMGAATAPEALLALQDTAWYEAIPADDMRAG
ncbi:hypothetical protein [Pseudoxanthomonas sp. YR558]|nr:hypothetical protein [Pseudoxanthomonas sp. YR558]PPJ42202.1 hypothetical protein C0063_02535 [Pseudoxanthomonas sp. KAs_5_3]